MLLVQYGHIFFVLAYCTLSHAVTVTYFTFPRFANFRLSVYEFVYECFSKESSIFVSFFVLFFF